MPLVGAARGDHAGHLVGIGVDRDKVPLRARKQVPSGVPAGAYRDYPPPGCHPARDQLALAIHHLAVVNRERRVAADPVEKVVGAVGLGAGHHRLQRLLVGGDRLAAATLPGKRSLHRLARCVAEPPPARAGRRAAVDPLRQSAHVPWRHQLDAPARGGDLLGSVLAAAADRRHAARHRLDVRDAERLVDARHHEQRAGGRARLWRLSFGSWPRNSTRSATPSDPASAPAVRVLGRRRRSRSAAPGDASRSTASAEITSACRLRAARWATVTSVGVAVAAGRAAGTSAPRCTTRVGGTERARIAARCRRCWRARAGRARASRGRVAPAAPAPCTSWPWTDTTSGDAPARRAEPRPRRGPRSGRGPGRTRSRGAAGERAAQQRRCPGSPGAVAQRPGRGQIAARTATSIPSSSRAARLARAPPRRGGRPRGPPTAVASGGAGPAPAPRRRPRRPAPDGAPTRRRPGRRRAGSTRRRPATLTTRTGA